MQMQTDSLSERSGCSMARYVLKLPPLPQMVYYQDDGAPSPPGPFKTVQVRSYSSTRSLGGMGGGGSSEAKHLDQDQDQEESGGGGCLHGLRRGRGRGRGRGQERNGKGSGGAMEAGITLQHDDIRFTPAQLARAEAVFADIVRDDMPSTDAVPAAPGVEAVSERLVQRLLCSVGSMDPRFSCKYLVCLDRRPSGDNDGLTLEYLVRLDALSSPALYPCESDAGTASPCRVVEGAAREAVPQGYARLRMQGPALDQWAEFLSPGGFLRRDKVQERFVELLATAAAPISSPSPSSHGSYGMLGLSAPMPAPRGPRGPHSPLQVDESRLCGAPGKVIDAAILPDLLALPADGQLFLASGMDRYPDPRDARIAIVEGSPWVRLRLGLSRDVLVKLVLGVGTERWPRGSDLPARVPLNHPDCLLYQHMATTGCFLVGCGPPSGLRCDDRPCTWQVWAPCGVAVLLRHYGPRSAVSRSLRAVEAVRRALALRSVSRHAMRSLLLWRLERGDHTMADWVPGAAPVHVIAVLDRLVSVLRGASERCYLFPALHVLSASARQGQPLGEDALLGDANALAGFLRRLHADCSSNPATSIGGSGQQRRDSQDSVYWPGEEDSRRDCWSRLEEDLLPAWKVALRDTAPPAATRSRRLGFRLSNGNSVEAAQFSPKQLLYIGALLRGLLLCRSLRIEGPSSHSWFPGTMRRYPMLSSHTSTNPETTELKSSTITTQNEGDSGSADAEDVACLVAVVLEQARTYALSKHGAERAGIGGSPLRRCGSSSSASSASRDRARAARAREVKTSKGRGRKRSESLFRRRYDSAVDLLLEAIRSDPGVVVPADDSALVGCVLRWLVASADRAPRALAGPLRRFLRALASAAHSCAPLHALWAASRTRARDELAAIGVFCRLVDSGRVQPLQGMVEAADKGWEWARWLLRLSARLPGGVHGVLAPSPGRVLRFSLPSDSLPARWLTSSPSLATSRRASATSTPHATMTPTVARMYRAALAAGNPNGAVTDVVLDGETSASGSCDADAEDGWEPLHGRLRQATPLSALLLQRHRMGLHRAIGDLLPALLALRKYTIIQEAAWSLPEPYRSEALDGVARIARETRRRSAARSRITPTHTLSRSGESLAEVEQYRLTSEMSRLGDADERAAGEEQQLSEADRRLELELRRMRVADSLLGTCRAARAGPGPLSHSVDITSMFEDPEVSPVYPGMPASGPQPDQGNMFSFLELTHDKQLRLGPPPPRQRHRSSSAKGRDAVTKL